MKTRKGLSNRLARSPWLLAGTVVERYLKCRRKGCEICREHGGHGPAYYLSVCQDGRTRMIYIPKDHLAEVRKAISDYQAVRDGLRELTRHELRKWRDQRGRRS